MSQIKNDYLVIGDRNAPVQIEVFLNYACPHCSVFYGFVDTLLPQYFDKNQVALIIKHYDKPKAPLLNGTLINLYLDYTNTEKTLATIKDLFKNFSTWKQLSDIELRNHLTNEYDLKEEAINTERSLLVTAEAIERNVTGVPTLFINGERFDYLRDNFAKDFEEAIQTKLK